MKITIQIQKLLFFKLLRLVYLKMFSVVPFLLFSFIQIYIAKWFLANNAVLRKIVYIHPKTRDFTSQIQREAKLGIHCLVPVVRKNTTEGKPSYM